MNSSGKTILVAGGAGYIGSHTVVELLEAGHSLDFNFQHCGGVLPNLKTIHIENDMLQKAEIWQRVVVIDDLSNSQSNRDDELDLPPSLSRAKQLTGRDCLHFYKGNIIDKDLLNTIFDTHKIDTVFDFTGKKAVGESTHLPILYYKNNISGTTNLIKCMRDHEVRNLLFSSSCTVYGAPGSENLPVKETDPVGNCHCPYAKCKYVIEQLLQDMAEGEPDYWRIIIMRYFNPVGAHESGMIGEDPKGEPQNLLPKLAQTAVGTYQLLEVFGEDYGTADGSAIRDYVHVVDVAKAHTKAVKKYQEMTKPIEIYNIGSGKGSSTWDIINAFERVCQKQIPLRVCSRRPGDVPAIYCDPSKAERDLGWKSERTNEQMCADLWKFYLLNPNGYQDPSTLRNTVLDLEY